MERMVLGRLASLRQTGHEARSGRPPDRRTWPPRGDTPEAVFARRIPILQSGQGVPGAGRRVRLRERGILPRRAPGVPIIRDAILGGEVRSGTDAEGVIDLLYAPRYYRLQMGTGSLIGDLRRSHLLARNGRLGGRSGRVTVPRHF